MRYLLIVCGFFFAMPPLAAQTGGLVGVIYGEESGEEIMFATVKVHRIAEGSVFLAGGAISDVEGRFEVRDLEPGWYRVVVENAPFEREMGEFEVSDEMIRVVWRFPDDCAYTGEGHRSGKCPAGRHGRRGVIPIIYGLPVGEETFAAEAAGKIMFGGCSISECMPMWYCKRHDRKF